MATLYGDGSPISSIEIHPGEPISIADLAVRDRVTDLFYRVEQLETQRQVEFVELSCRNCGGKIQQKYKDPIFKCPYCKTVYAVGYRQVNA